MRRPQPGAQSGLCIYQFGGGGSWNFDAEFKFVKIQNSHVEGGGARGILMLSSNLLKSKIPILRGEGACGNLMLISNLLKSKIPMSGGGGGGGARLVEPIFNF